MYDKDELEILDYIETQNIKSVDDLESKINKIKTTVSEKNTKRKAINLKVLESDIEKFKAKALQEGMPYQTLINSVLHKYITGSLVDKSQMAS